MILRDRRDEPGSGQYALTSPDGRVRWETLDEQPRLDQLRQLSREVGTPLKRLDLWESDLHCQGEYGCGTEIEGRFGAGPDRGVLCWDCVTELTKDSEAQVDPTKAVIGKSELHKKSLCDYVLNVCSGCNYGCEFCYVPASPNIWGRAGMLDEYADVNDGDEEWGEYLLYRDDAPERLAHVASSRAPAGWDGWRRTSSGRGIVGLSFHTDCYQDRRAAQLTRECVIELVNHEQYVRILTRSPAVTRDIDVFEEASPYVTVGSSIPTLDAEENAAIEPDSPPPRARLDALKELSDAGIPTFVSLSPTYPTQGEAEIREIMEQLADLETLEVVFHEPINHRGGNMERLVEGARSAGEDALAEALEGIESKDEWAEYALEQLKTVRSVADELSVPVKLWPDQALRSYTDGSDHRFCESEFERPSPETFGPRENEEETASKTLTDFAGQK